MRNVHLQIVFKRHLTMSEVRVTRNRKQKAGSDSTAETKAVGEVPSTLSQETADERKNPGTDQGSNQFPQATKSIGLAKFSSTPRKRLPLAKPDESKDPEPVAAIADPSASTTVADVEDMQIAKKPKWVPLYWKETLQYIQRMREDRTAPVDTMGCERTMEEDVTPKVRRFQVLVSLMLSSQTKDEVTFAAMDRLKGHGLTVQSILDMEEGALGQMLIPVGFWKKKASYIKRATQILHSDYDDDIPDTIEGLCALPGVGPKMGYIALAVAWGKHSGIGVDTHVHRICNRLGWVGAKGTKTPEQTRAALEGWLPMELWPDINILLVGFGQTICTPLHPKCSSCLANQHCPYASKSKR